MKLFFRSCHLNFEIDCSSNVIQIAKPLVGSFLEVNGHSQFLLNLSSHGRFSRSSDSHPGAFNLCENQDSLIVTNWARRSVAVELHHRDPRTLSAAIGYLLVKALSQTNGLLLHAALLLRDNRTYLFLGVSGAGKSTLAGNARGFTCVHDDRVAVRRQRGRWWAYGVPMLDNQGRPGMPLAAPIAGLYLIKKSTRLWLRKLKQRSAVEYFIPQVTVPVADSNTYKKSFSNLANLISEVPCYRLGFEKHSDVGVVI